MSNVKKRRMMFIGPVGAGKTTLKQALYNDDFTYDKTQAVEFHEQIIDTPGEFIQHRHFYSTIQNLSAEVDIIAFISSGIDTSQVFSPGFAHIFVKPCIGIITKRDIASQDQLKLVRDNLKLAGIEKIFEVSSVEQRGTNEILAFIEMED